MYEVEIKNKKEKTILYLTKSEIIEAFGGIIKIKKIKKKGKDV